MDPKASISLPAWSHLQTKPSEITHLWWSAPDWGAHGSRSRCNLSDLGFNSRL